MESYLKAIRGCTDFAGRTTRLDFWMYQLVAGLVFAACIVLDHAFGFTPGAGGNSLFYALAAIFHVVPGLSVSVRRLHDTGRSGWWMLIGYTPLLALPPALVDPSLGAAALILSLAGPICLFAMYCLKSSPEANRFGPAQVWR